MDAAAVGAHDAARSEHERDRLLSPEELLERVLTTRLLEPHLGAPGRALDLGGGTGPYAVWLAELGWDVSRTDPSREPAATAASWGDGTFGAVVSLGATTHLTAADDRARAATELARVTRPGGLVAVALVPRDALVRRLLEAHGFSTLALASTHGFLTGVEDEAEALRVEHPAAYCRLLDRLVATASDPRVLATARHLLYVGRRQEPTRPDS